MKALVTGGAGFIGVALSRYLLEMGFKVVIYDNFLRNSIKYQADLASNPQISVVEGNVCDINALKSLGSDFTHIFHLAAIAGVSKYFSIPAEVMNVNTLGTNNILEFALHQSVMPLVLDFSTSEIYGSNCFNVNENTEVRMENHEEKRWTYASSKIASERFMMAYHWQYNIPVVIIRPFNIYGEGQTGEGVLSNFITRAIRNETLHITGNGQQIRSFCHIDDFIDGISIILNVYQNTPEKISGEIFNIGSDKTVITMSELSSKVISLSKSSSLVRCQVHQGADVLVRSPNIDKLRSFGFCPKISLQEGILKAISWYKNQHIVPN